MFICLKTMLTSVVAYWSFETFIPIINLFSFLLWISSICYPLTLLGLHIKCLFHSVCSSNFLCLLCSFYSLDHRLHRLPWVQRLFLSLLYRIGFVVVILLLPHKDLIPCWLYFKMSFCGDCLKVVGHTSRFSLELGPVEDHHRSSYSVFLCCLPLSVFIFCSGFQDFYSLYPCMLQMYSL